MTLKKKTVDQPPAKKKTLVNEMIRAQFVRLISAEGEQLGIIPLPQAMEIAATAGMDLVEVAPGSSPPVCRVMDYGRYKFVQAKKAQEARRKSSQVVIKEVKVRPKTEEHDLQVKLKKAREFLEEGNRVKVSMMFRGREMSYAKRGQEMLEEFARQLEGLGNVELTPRTEGRNMFLVMAPKPGAVAKAQAAPASASEEIEG